LCRAGIGFALGGEAGGLRPVSWRPPVALSPAEQQIGNQIRRVRLLVLLRQRRHELVSEEFQSSWPSWTPTAAKGSRRWRRRSWGWR
jgi:hypothetical protein